MNEKLQLALTTVSQERTGKFDKSFTAVQELLTEYLPEELADQLVVDIPPNVPWEVAADILGILIWSTSDNGALIMRGAERWLVEANNARLVQIALGLDIYPFETNDEMRRVLANVAHLLPEVAAECELVINRRARVNE